MNKIKHLYLITLVLFPAFSQANSSLEDDLSQFVDNKFQSEKYQDLDFYDFEMVEDFNPDKIKVNENTFQPESINSAYLDVNDFDFNNLNTEESQELEILKAEYKSLKQNNQKKQKSNAELQLISQDIIDFANTIPLLKTEHAKLIQTNINNQKHFLIKFQTPEGMNVSFKKVITLSFPEDSTKTLEDINNLSNKIKTFNKIDKNEFFVNKKNLYIPLSFLK